VKKTIVIGGGAAGIMAAIQAAGCSDVYLVEKMPRLGLKILVSGKGRCNVTNAGSIQELINAFGRNGKFLYHAFSEFSNEDLRAFLRNIGVETKVERGKRVFPVSDRSKDVLNALKNKLEKSNVHVILGKAAKSFVMSGKNIVAVELSDGTILNGNYFIIATGGKSFPGLGTTGDGFALLKKLGHTIKPLYPSLVPLLVKEEWVHTLEGLSLRNVRITVNEKNKKFSHFGDMVFTDKGISGPIVLSLSSEVVPLIKEELRAEIDLKPALTREVLDNRLRREFKENGKKKLKNVLPHLLPVRLIPVFLQLSGVDADKKCSEITKSEREKLVTTFKKFPITITGNEGFTHAIVTKGGVSLKEVDPRSMRSKIIGNLFIVGELLDLDAVTGGYNLQASFSTGFVAGRSICKTVNG
jgi:predicted Rossmann fold flavoprotein